jgi:hypothetical protein
MHDPGLAFSTKDANSDLLELHYMGRAEISPVLYQAA